ncbi:BlaR1 peptidase M56 [Granulicella pectinivorans]|uniref:BlaR1 peptidase M56 n=1 Tax=Granulicella pectinivorans TaxID=474950 RepID=A0A1I6MQ44_9BACT|nr:M56 family metallopeptidase [Granulicella pectinivorans]SFS17833.1 BlaR1 peptidase M56 [Granulicella pectinivorans]
MPLLLGTFAHLFALAGSALVASAWEGCVLVAAVAFSLRLLPGIPARARSLVWLAVMMLVVALTFVHASHATGESSNGGIQIGLGWTLALAAIWLGLSAVRAARLLWSAALLRGIATRARRLAVSPEITHLLNGRAIVCVSDEVSVPSVAGFFAPRILIPSGIVDRLSEQDLRQIVVHEREHLRRGDDWVNLLQKLSLVLFPLNPALVWVERRLCAEREMACDDAVLKATGSPKAYASCLASLAEHTLVRRGVSLALGAWERRPELARRVARILARPQGEMRRSRAVVAAMLVGVVAGGGALSRSPQIVRFASSVDAPVATLRPMASDGAHMVLASAVVPIRHDGGLVGDGIVPAPKPMAHKPERRRSRPALSPTVAQDRAAQPDPEARMVTVRVDAALPARRVLLAFDEDSQISYAAVPVRNGWLIFQL